MRFVHGARFVFGALALATAAGSVRADFVGQPLLGPLTIGVPAVNSTVGKADDNDGFDSGIHIFNIWDGGDDVFTVNWAGGDLTVTLINLPGGGDNDLFVYSPGSLDSTGDYSILGALDPDVVTILGAGPGTYYINVDSTFFSEGGYEVTVTPTPGVAVMMGMGMVGVMRRRRR
jgi:hypothetical protein